MDGARIDVPVLRFRELEAELDAVGAVALALVDDRGAEAAVVAIDAARASVGDCRLTRATDAPVRATRRGASIELAADGASVSCAASGLPERVGVAVIAASGARLRSLALARLP